MANEWNKAVTKPYEMYAGKKANSNATMDTSIGPNMSRGTKSKSQKEVDTVTSQATEPKATASEGSFKDAFKDARKDGKKSFTWKGKKYNTEVAGEDKPEKMSEPMPTGDIGSRQMFEEGETAPAFKRGGKVKKMAGGGSASSRGDGCAQRGKTKGRFV